nr:endolytic transglycosylase MltG [uncultured Cellulosilyticum sp.]
MAKRHTKLRVIGSMIFSLVTSVLLLLGSIIALYSSYNYTSRILAQEASREANEAISEMTLEIDADTSLHKLAHHLKENGFISNIPYFKVEAFFAKVKPPFKPGKYTVSSNMSSSEILAMLTTDITDEEETVRFMIPEGYTIPQIAAKLDSEGIVESTVFLDAVQNRTYDYDFLKDIPENVTYKLEGYLFPDTYIVRKGATPEEIIVKMLTRFKEVTDKYNTYLSNTNYSLHEILTIASMIEGEAKLAEERATISGVIYNRLDAHMNLQMCSTIQYLLDKRKVNLSFDDLKVDSPYNTYLYSGLPPGPICNPGEASFEAALLPEVHDYYYFVVLDNETGAHHFSKTAEEHSKTKAQYQQSIDKNFYE